MTDTLGQIIIILLLILANGFFSMAEISLLSVRRGRLEQLEEEGDKRARTALEVSSSHNRLLSTVQIGITLVAILTGAIGSAALGNTLAALLMQVEFLAPIADGLSIFLVVLVITYMTLVIGELIPKRLALNAPERIALRVSGIMKAIETIARPVVYLLGKSTELGLRILRIKPSNEPAVTEDEIMSLIDQGIEEGIVEESEQDMVESIFRFGDRTADGIMTPRTEVEWIDLEDPVDNIIHLVANGRYARYPVSCGDLDHIQGILNAKELLARCVRDEPIDFATLLKPALFIPESMSALTMLEQFKQKAADFAVVIDEYGGVLGVVTMHDVLTDIIGEISDQGGPAEPEVLEREDGSWLLDGMLPVEELKELIAIKELPDEDRAGYQTAGGFVMSTLGGVPSSGEHFELLGYRFEVVDMDNRRVDKILVSKLPPSLEDDPLI
jgi:putative hemolysin